MPPVLIVDDDPDIRSSFAFMLQAEGYQTLTAANGKEALDLLRTIDPPCLILLDLLMPVMDGVQFLSVLRGGSDLAAIPVVIVSAASTVQPPPDTPRLSKPVPIDRLLSHVERHCGPAA